MENDTPASLRPVHDGLDDAVSTLAAARNLATRRQNTGALRTMFAVPDTAPKPDLATAAKVDQDVQLQRPNSSVFMPRL